MSRRRVVVTGLGLITPIGKNVTETWSNTLDGKSGVELISAFDTSDYTVKIGAPVRDFFVEEYMDRKRSPENRPLHSNWNGCRYSGGRGFRIRVST